MPVIQSPLPGTFYRSSSPETPPFKADGDAVAVGDVIASDTSSALPAGLLRKVLSKQTSHHVTEMQGKRVEISVAEPMPYQFDGDTLGEASHFEAEVVPGAITVMLPRG